MCVYTERYGSFDVTEEAARSEDPTVPPIRPAVARFSLLPDVQRCNDEQNQRHEARWTASDIHIA